MKNDKKVFLFQLKKDKLLKIKTLCDSLNIQAISVTPPEYSRTIGQLAGITGDGSSNGSNTALSSQLPGMGIPQMEMMVFSGISSELLDTFLAEYKKAAIESIPLKAVVTPFNIHWDICTLYKELLKEYNWPK